MRAAFTYFYKQLFTSSAKDNGMVKVKLQSVLAAVVVLLLCITPHINGKSSIKNSENYNSFCIFGMSEQIDDGSAVSSAEDEYVYLGGYPMGIVIGTDGIIVLGTAEVKTEQGSAYPLKDSGLRSGDVLQKINNADVDGLYDLRRLVNAAKGDAILTVKRGGQTFEVSATPVLDKLSGEKRLGLLAKEDVAGVGTMTFITENGVFAGLGHRIADGESGLFRELDRGRISDISIDGVVKGEKGKAGGLVASVNRLAKATGNITENTEIGLYGKYKGENRGQKIRVAREGEAKMGAAQVFSTLDGNTPKLYDIDIVKVVGQSDSAEKGLVIAVRDKALLDKAGGIVQGMSGSPIIQNGALVGAVTHVFVSNPERGYGVHARFMLDRANAQPALYGRGGCGEARLAA